MKKNIFTYVLIIVFISFMLAGCVSKSEKLNELEKKSTADAKRDDYY